MDAGAPAHRCGARAIRQRRSISSGASAPGSTTTIARCATSLKPPQFATANDWIGHVNAMKRYTPLNSEEVSLLRSYLQNHAKE